MMPLWCPAALLLQRLLLVSLLLQSRHVSTSEGPTVYQIALTPVQLLLLLRLMC